MKPDQIDQAIDHVAGLLKIGIRRIVEETESAASSVTQTVGTIFGEEPKPGNAAPTTSASPDESSIPLIGTRRKPSAVDSPYTVLAFSRIASDGTPLLLVRFEYSGSTGEYPATQAVKDQIFHRTPDTPG